MRKKIITITVLLLLIFAGIIALTQEKDEAVPDIENALPEYEGDEIENNIVGDFFQDDWLDEEIPEWVKPVRWFRSNAGGMALEEVSSRVSALRNEYALVIDFINQQDLPDYLIQYYERRYFIEVRTLYKRGEESRVQWIFRDRNGTTRLIAVFAEPEDDKGDDDVADGEDEEKKDYAARLEPDSGFIEIFDENSFLLTEYRFYDKGKITKTEYNYNNGIIIYAAVLELEEYPEKFAASFTDFFRYNRSGFLRSVDRVYYADSAVRVVFPYNIINAAGNIFMDAKLNSYPEFFGDLFVKKNNKIVFTSDDRGRILTQTLYDTEKEENIIWTIINVWSNDRIVSITKTEGDTLLLAEYGYDSGQNRILERNLRNGVLERLVRTEKTRDIEELYMDNVVVLQAVWEGGRKISETRVSPGIKGN